MSPEQYIQSRLDTLRSFTPVSFNGDISQEIFRRFASKKFRKYALTPEFVAHAQHAIRSHVEKSEPINITFLHGAYKLWRLEEAPYPDWGELFALIYFSNWAKTICEVYKPGVWFEFFVDDLIIPKLNNVPIAEVDTYLKAYRELQLFMKLFQPPNLRMTITEPRTLFGNEVAFDEALARAMEEAKQKVNEGLPVLSDAQRATIELNVRLRPGQSDDPLWREKNQRLHDAYAAAKRTLQYHYVPEKILAFTQPFSNGAAIGVGSTKTSIAKFWVGVGALKPRDDRYIETILSPSQLAQADFHWENLHIDGLDGKNFKRVRILEGKTIY